MVDYEGAVLAGGRGTRMGTPRKHALTVGGRPMIETVRAALSGARRVHVVGPDGDLVEDPPGGGPVAALAAVLPRLTAQCVVVVAADLPLLTADAVERLVAAAPAVAVDGTGRRQYLLGAYLTDDLRAAIPPQPADASMRKVVAALAAPAKPVEIARRHEPPGWWDCDTPAELEAARRWS